VSANALGKEKPLRDHAFSQFLCTLHEIESRDIFFSSRMSLSHLGGWKQEGLRIHLALTSRGTAGWRRNSPDAQQNGSFSDFQRNFLPEAAFKQI
jgi:hypothetical protein